METLLVGGMEMKRDMDLMRAILFDAEANEHAFVEQPSIEGFSPEQIGYHIYLLGKAGLAEVIDTTGFNQKSPSAKIVSLTWGGHEFIDLARNDTIWNKAKEKLDKITSGVTIQVWMAVLTDIIKLQLGI